MKSLMLAGLPVLVLLAGCDSQDNSTTSSETPAVAGDDGNVAAPADPMASAPSVDNSSAMGAPAGTRAGDATDSGPSPAPGTASGNPPPVNNDAAPPTK
jgi:hypothetical protein